MNFSSLKSGECDSVRGVADDQQGYPTSGAVINANKQALYYVIKLQECKTINKMLTIIS